MPGIKIYGDNTDQSKAKNKKLYKDAQEWYSNSSWSWAYVDAVLIDNIIMDKYDGNYKYEIFISKNYISVDINNKGNFEFLVFVLSDGSVDFGNNDYNNMFPSPLETAMPGLKIYTDSKSKNIKLYNRAIQWRKDYISYKGLSDTGQPIKINVDGLVIGNKTIDKYDRHFNYYINIYNNRITLANYSDDLEILAISSDGSVDVHITPTPTPDSDTTTM